MVKGWGNSVALLVLVAFLPLFMGCNEEANIPVPAQEFIKEYFPKSTVVLVEMDVLYLVKFMIEL